MQQAQRFPERLAAGLLTLSLFQLRAWIPERAAIDLGLGDKPDTVESRDEDTNPA